jgi:hypothetical protein
VGGCVGASSVNHSEIANESLHKGFVQFLLALDDILVIKGLDEICEHLWLLPSFRVMLLQFLQSLPHELLSELAEKDNLAIKSSVVASETETDERAEDEGHRAHELF